jgi:hypothetical protein
MGTGSLKLATSVSELYSATFMYSSSSLDSTALLRPWPPPQNLAEFLLCMGPCKTRVIETEN